MGDSMAYAAAIFDLDGTLLNTLEDLWCSANYALRSLDMPERSIDDIRRFVGNGYHRLFELAAPEGTSEEQILTLLSRFNAYYLAHDEDHTRPYPGIVELVEHIHSAGIPCAVVSNKGDAAVRDLMHKQFGGIFEAVAGEREHIRRKPAPDVVFAVMEQLGVGADEIVYVGDSEVDIATAANVGCDCVIVTWGYRDIDELRAAGAQVFAHDTDELERIICEGS